MPLEVFKDHKNPLQGIFLGEDICLRGGPMCNQWHNFEKRNQTPPQPKKHPPGTCIYPLLSGAQANQTLLKEKVGAATHAQTNTNMTVLSQKPSTCLKKIKISLSFAIFEKAPLNYLLICHELSFTRTMWKTT